MIVTTRQLEREINYVRSELSALRDRYWELRHAHERLLNHLQVLEVQIPNHIVLRKKGGPEGP